MTTYHALPCCARVLTHCMASVSECRAAGRRWRAGVIAALQIPAFTGTRHQTRARPYAIGLTRNDLSAVVPPTADRLRTRKPSIHAVVPVSAVVPVQNTTPRSASPADAQPRCPAAGRWCWCRWLGMSWGRGHPPRHGSFPGVLGYGSKRSCECASKHFFLLG